MISFKSFKQKLFRLDENNFESVALSVFRFQAIQNPVYNAYIKNLDIEINNVKRIMEIPFLPISFFKHHQVKTGQWESETVFKSSGTTGQIRSSHCVKELAYYDAISTAIFEQHYGGIKGYTFLALLPSYLEREGSSLVHMISHFIKYGSDLSGFFLNNYDELIARLKTAREQNQKVLLIGVSFALLDLAENYNLDLSDVIVMETGGMKGRRKEMVRSELHTVLKKSFNVPSIHSEYGMTELMSQAYSKKEGKFVCPAWMRVFLRDINDPFDLKPQSVGGINIIDLANIDTCSFIETQDMGHLNEDATFEVLGRIDNSEIRGCNLLISNY